MSKYPRLTDMGVLHPKQIDRFSVNSFGYTDVLRVVYERPKGSLLPSSRTYKFPRIQKSVKAKNGNPEIVMESDPALRAVLDELQDLTCKKKHIQDVAGSILEELSSLKEDVALRSDYIKELVSKIKPE